MSVSLTNRDDMVVNSISLIQQSGLCDLCDNLIETVASLPNKADKATTYTKTQTYSQPEVDALLSDLSNTGLQQKTELKADIADVDSRLALKADKSNTHTKTEIVEFLDVKADKTAVTAGLNLKMNISNAYDKTEINDLLDVKADKTTVQTELSSKMEITNAYDKTAIDNF